MNPRLSLIRSSSPERPLRREINVEPKVLDAGKGIVRFVASDETMDCYNEIVRVSGWRFTHFQKNAPFVNSHDYSDVRNLFGQVIRYAVEDGALVEDVQFALTPGGDTLADWVFAMYRDKFLRACSVGFSPQHYATKWDSDKTLLLSQITDLKLDAQAAAKLNVVYIEQEQLELSGCIIGANPNALAKSMRSIADAYKGGSINEHAVETFSDLIARAKTVRSSADRADDERARRRARAAISLEILNLL